MKMSWKSLGMLFAAIVFCATVSAQNEPFLGVWELNLQKSTNVQQLSQTIINVPTADGFKSIRANVGKDRSSTEIHPVVFDGKPHQTEGGDPREISYKQLDSNTIERTHNRNGKISVDTEQISKDGKTLTVKQGDSVRVYDKQFNVKEAGH
jgi:hypothetical protein